MKDKVRRLAAFAVFMQKNDGISGKAPSYLLEKYDLCMTEKNPENYMDADNRVLFDKYIKDWRVKDEE
jgi:hypothetical protein